MIAHYLSLFTLLHKNKLLHPLKTKNPLYVCQKTTSSNEMQHITHNEKPFCDMLWIYYTLFTFHTISSVFRCYLKIVCNGLHTSCRAPVLLFHHFLWIAYSAHYLLIVFAQIVCMKTPLSKNHSLDETRCITFYKTLRITFCAQFILHTSFVVSSVFHCCSQIVCGTLELSL